jgi:SCY1-like protein 1
LIARLLSEKPSNRPSPSEILSKCEAFRVPLVGLLLFLDELPLKEPKDKARFFTSLPGLLARVPNSIALYKLLPALLVALEYGAAGGGGTVVLAPILEIGSRLPADEYARVITPVVVRLFGSLDRATRVQLLTHLPAFIDKLSDDIINNTILPSMAAGFSDSAFPLREATVKACLPLAPRASPTALRTLIIANLKRSLGDNEPGIRVNATICLGRIAEHVEGAPVRESELLASFLREMRDPFPHARSASLRAAAYCVALEDGRYWTADVVARRLLPAAAHLSIDTFADARVAAFSLIDMCLRALHGEDVRLSAAEAAQIAAAERGELNNQTNNNGLTTSTTTASSSASSSTGGGVGTVVFSALGWAVGGFSSAAAATSMSGTMTAASVSPPTESIPISHTDTSLRSSRETAATTRVAEVGHGSATSSAARTGTTVAVAHASAAADEGWGDDDNWGNDAPARSPVRKVGGLSSKVKANAPTSTTTTTTTVNVADGWGDDNSNDNVKATSIQESKAVGVSAARGMKLKATKLVGKKADAAEEGWDNF